MNCSKRLNVRFKRFPKHDSNFSAQLTLAMTLQQKEADHVVSMKLFVVVKLLSRKFTFVKRSPLTRSLTHFIPLPFSRAFESFFFTCSLVSCSSLFPFGPSCVTFTDTRVKVSLEISGGEKMRFGVGSVYKLVASRTRRFFGRFLVRFHLIIPNSLAPFG